MKKIIITDFRITKEEENSLKKLNYKVLKCPKCKNLYDAVCGHPDMLIHFLDKSNLVVHKDIDLNFKNQLKNFGLNIIKSNTSLISKYPYDICLNALNTNDLFVHYLKYTDKVILNNIKNKKILNVKQGYTKCSTAIVNNNAFITSDKNIKNILLDENKDVLFLPPGDILLPGLDYGFIGGSCGLIDKDLLAFFGDLKYYKYGDEVYNFLKKHNVKPVFLKNGPLIDRGSIFCF